MGSHGCALRDKLARLSALRVGHAHQSLRKIVLSSPSITAHESKRIARNAVVLASASLISKGLLFIWQFVLARWIGETAYGIYGTVGGLAVIASIIGSFSMGLIVIREVSREPSKAGAYFASTLFLQTFLMGVAYIVLNGSAWALGYSETIRVFTALSGVALLMDLFGNICSDQLLAQEKMLSTALVDTLHIAFRIGATAWALAQGYDLVGLYAVGIVASFARSLVMGATLIRTGVHPRFPLERALTIQLLVNSLPLAVSAFFTLIYQQADKLLSTRFLSEATTGFLTAAYVIVQAIIELFSTTVLVATYPMMSRTYGRGELFGFVLEKLAFFTAVITLPVGLILGIFAPFVTLPLFGADFAPTASILRILVWYAVITMIVNVFAQGMLVQNQQRRLLIIKVVGVLLNVGFNLLTVLWLSWGVYGLVIASVVAELLTLQVMFFTFREVGTNMLRLTRKLALLATVGLGVAGVMLGVGAVASPLLAIMIGVGLYAVLMMRLPILDAEEWDLLYRLLASIPIGKYILHIWHRQVEVNW